MTDVRTASALNRVCCAMAMMIAGMTQMSYIV